MKKNKFSLGGEQSGHIILGELMSTGDGILSALKVLEILSKYKKRSSELFNLYKSYPQIKSNLFIKKKLTKKIEKKIKFLSNVYLKKYDDVRILIRSSGTEPIVRLLVEGSKNSDTKAVYDKILIDLKKVLNAK